MPETNFKIEWPDGEQELCYSPSLVVKKYFNADQDYSLSEFVALSRTALNDGSDRVKAQFGFSCSKALGQLKIIEDKAKKYSNLSDPKVRLLKFIDVQTTE
ncbi:MSMEG_0570 family nitrogen starvation response protein [Moorena sp. SIO3H5]|uniref:MSMEG_0570 family nitrogen starvation response protein n=1 Tax=Moorena sp. SIO3H5 TaxID=2607834 RepID=UPI0013BA8B2D|nr:MSMEG_0570 family nitrogen starvation response protein [Moorena sp. SIO3H5]NEO69423.1 MSMEG_0570 family nitrogen starvation response protein [Moorena sp. SIO3H5]